MVIQIPSTACSRARVKLTLNLRLAVILRIRGNLILCNLGSYSQKPCQPFISKRSLVRLLPFCLFFRLNRDRLGARLYTSRTEMVFSCLQLDLNLFITPIESESRFNAALQKTCIVREGRRRHLLHFIGLSIADRETASALALIHLISSPLTRMTPLQFTVSKQPLGCLRSD